MPALRYTINYKSIILREQPGGERVAVLRKSGQTRDVLWLGFMELAEARSRPANRPVKLLVEQYQISKEWFDVPEGAIIQGCLKIGDGVYGVLVNEKPRILFEPNPR